MQRLYFIRHGESQMNADGVWAGRSETPLTELGRTQAKRAGEQARSLGIDYIISSPLSRAYDTARIIAQEIGYSADDVIVHPLLIERFFGDMEGQPWSSNAPVDTFPNAESLDTLLERAGTAFDHFQKLKADTILVVSHGSFGRALRHIMNPEIPFAPTSTAHRFANAEIVQLL